jgi:23S rRNA (uracil747-C5)-methyltransferase
LTIAARTGARVDAWEVHAGAIEAGRRLARSTGLRWEGTVADLEHVAVDLDPAVDRIVVNPPRRGLSAGVIDTLRQRGNVPVLYMSCSPESFARDVSTLGRPLRRIEAWDMMPGSPHLELLADLGPR